MAKRKHFWEIGLVLLGLIALVYTKPYNFDSWLNLGKDNDFLDITVRLADLVLVIILILKIVFEKLRLKRWFWWLLSLVVVNLLVILIGSNAQWQNICHFSLVWIRLMSWVMIFQSVKMAADFKGSALIVFLLYSVFEHLLISSSLGVLLVWLVIELNSFSQGLKTRLSQIFVVGLLTHFLIALGQVFTGKYVGLNWLGEPLVNLSTVGGVAKQELFGTVFLRGYGLTPHPNILGFVGLLSLIFVLQADLVGRHLKYITSCLCLGIILLSFSRLAWLGLAVVVLKECKVSEKIGARFDTYKISWRKIWIPILGFSTILIALGVVFASRANADVYRLADLNNFASAYFSMSLTDKLFGLGLGQYAFFLQSNFDAIFPWQFQPVHNLWLNLIAELGIIGMIWLAFVVWVVINDKKKDPN